MANPDTFLRSETKTKACSNLDRLSCSSCPTCYDSFQAFLIDFYQNLKQGALGVGAPWIATLSQGAGKKGKIIFVLILCTEDNLCSYFLLWDLLIEVCIFPTGAHYL